MKKTWINLLLFCLITVCCTAQTGGYKFYSKLDSVKTSGFYNIELTSELNARLKTDHSDLRIVNDSGKWVPHVLHAPANNKIEMSLFTELKFLMTENFGVSTVLIIESGQKISDNLSLIITNTTAERFCTLSGTNDRANWFVINDSIFLNPVAAGNATENIFTINFPPNSYRFYKIVIHNNNKGPLDIKGVVQHPSAYIIENKPNKLIQNPAAVIQQKDSGKISYIKVDQQQPFHFDNISLKLEGVKYFTRKVELYIPHSDNSSFSNPGYLLHSFTVSNNSTLQFQVPFTKASAFYLLVYNEDNLPLSVNEVKTSFTSRYITAYLDSGSNYKLIMDNEAAVMPNYDLSELRSKIPDSIPYLQFGKITAFPENILPQAETKNNTWILWTAIAAALVILIFFTYRMLKEVDKRKTT